MKLEFFEPPMCCPTGICGPSVDERLVRIKENIDYLEKKYENLETQRYMASTHPMKFMTNRNVNKLIKEKSTKALPIATLDGEVIKSEDYPTLEEMEDAIQGKK